MAKKKSDVSESETKAKKPAAKVKSGKASPTGGSSPMIDTSLAASAAANMLFMRSKGRDTLSALSSVSQIKSDLKKPTGDALHTILGNTAASGTNLSNLAPAQKNVVGKGQTNANAASRSSVPRRTGGG